jgi:N-acyl-D-aspartate/D-glutamate deacylase
MAAFDTIIKDGMIVDGTRVPRYKADIGIKAGKIAEIGRLKSSDADKVLDASGHIVAPGYIDLHTHYDAQIHWDPYCTIGSWHGVTSLTIGNCGFGFAPVKAKDVERSMIALSRNESIPLEPMRVSMKVDWETFPQYMDRLSKMPLGINIGHHLPLAPAVAYVMGGFDEAKKQFPGEREMFQLKRILHEAMDAGAMGWSAQRLVPESRVSVQRDYDGTPMITDILPDDFYLELGKSLGEKNDGCIQFTQSGATKSTFGIDDDFRFLEQLARDSGRPLLYNAVVINDNHPESHRAQLNWLREVNAKGLRIFGQAATVRAPVRMTLEDWNLFDSVPAWREATLGTTEERKMKLRKPEIRASMRDEYDQGGMETLAFVFGELAKWIARKVRRPDLKDKYEGLSVEQIAEREHKHVVDAMLDLTVEDDLHTEWAAPVINSRTELYSELLGPPYMMPGVSDGGAHIKFITPGIFPTEVLAWLTRDVGALTLEEAHYRLSGLTAWAAGFKDRGTLREGMAADVVVYDLNRLKVLPEEILYDIPADEWRRVQKCEGYRWIMVNGQPIFEEGNCTGTTPGKLLRNGRAAA